MGEVFNWFLSWSYTVTSYKKLAMQLLVKIVKEINL